MSTVSVAPFVSPSGIRVKPPPGLRTIAVIETSPPSRGDRQLEPGGVLREIGPGELDVRTVEVRARNLGGRLGRNAEERRLSRSRHGSRLADDRDDRVGAERLVVGERRSLERRDQAGLREVLLDAEVERHRVGGLRLEPVVEGRAVHRSEEAESQARDEERHGHGGTAGVARQRERREPDRRG